MNHIGAGSGYAAEVTPMECGSPGNSASDDHMDWEPTPHHSKNKEQRGETGKCPPVVAKPPLFGSGVKFSPYGPPSWGNFGVDSHEETNQDPGPRKRLP